MENGIRDSMLLCEPNTTQSYTHGLDGRRGLEPLVAYRFLVADPRLSPYFSVRITRVVRSPARARRQ
jgi:hypothetical protein